MKGERLTESVINLTFPSWEDQWATTSQKAMSGEQVIL